MICNITKSFIERAVDTQINVRFMNCDCGGVYLYIVVRKPK